MYCTSSQGNTYVMNHFHLHRKHLYIFNHDHLEKSTAWRKASPSFIYTLHPTQSNDHSPFTSIPLSSPEDSPESYPQTLIKITIFQRLQLSTPSNTCYLLYDILFEVIHMWIMIIGYKYRRILIRLYPLQLRFTSF